jgi:hypothetical protein
MDRPNEANTRPAFANHIVFFWRWFDLMKLHSQKNADRQWIHLKNWAICGRGRVAGLTLRLNGFAKTHARQQLDIVGKINAEVL